jgi:LPXTG-motif cell wall-anchored protein
MKKYAYVAVAAFAAFLVTLGFSSSAQAYPDVQINLTSSKQIVNAGDSVTVTAAANVECSWNETWNDESHASAGTKFVTSFVAPQVTKITKLPVKATCQYTAPAGDARSGAQSWSDDLTITVLPVASAAAAAGQSRADLPSTGGPNWVVVAGGVVLLLAGATAVTVARRRAEAELSAQTA